MTRGPYPVIACGDDALRIQCGAGDIRHRLVTALLTDNRWIDVVPGKKDVTVAFDPHTARMNEARGWIMDAVAASSEAKLDAGRRLVLDADFGGEAGPDLEAVARRLGCTSEAVVAAIEASPLEVDMLGFTPGFAYLTGLDGGLRSERLAHPRARVAAGSIGLITGQIGLYALDGPGGWPLVGRVRAPMFEAQRADPFVLRPGDQISLRRAKPAR